MLIYLSLLVCAVGLVVFLVAKNVDYKEVGRLSYFAGLFVFLYQIVPHMVGILK